MSNFLDGVPRIATEAECKAPWNGGPNGIYFRCGLCGHKFVVGDQWRGVYTNDIPGAGGNPLVCKDCDDSDLIIREQWKQMHVDWKEMVKNKFWWFARLVD